MLCGCCRPRGKYAAQIQTSTDRFLAFQAYVWDCIMSLPEEYKVFRKGRFAVPGIAYFLSRSV
jgi:hypothetical protein